MGAAAPAASPLASRRAAEATPSPPPPQARPAVARAASSPSSASGAPSLSAASPPASPSARRASLRQLEESLALATGGEPELAAVRWRHSSAARLGAPPRPGSASAGGAGAGRSPAFQADDDEGVYEAQKQFVIAQLRQPGIGAFYDDSDDEPNETVAAMRLNSRFV